MCAEANSLAKRKWNRRSWACLFIAAFANSAAKAQQPPIDIELSKAYFHEAQAASDRDQGLLWGQALYGPLLLIDPGTHMVVANQADREGKLVAHGGVWTGQFPDEAGAANTAIEWAGVHWTMVMWPLPWRRQSRLRLMMHECFHRVAPGIGLSPADASPAHLDTLDGRIWLEMEWRALESAMWSKGAAREQAIVDALSFRGYRRSLFPGAAVQEDELEMNEGLAEYTGMKLSTLSDEEFSMVEDGALRLAADQHPNFVRSFAYVSGPAYGLLLDRTGGNWRKGLTPRSDLGALLAQLSRVKVSAVDEKDAVRRARSYDGDEIIEAETRRNSDRQLRLAKARQRFLAGPVLILPVGEQFNYGFDPNHVLSLDESSTVYEGGQVSDTWGVLKAPDGFLLVRGASGVLRVQVPAPGKTDGSSLTGEGWTLELAPGWRVVTSSRTGDLILKPQ